MKEKHLREIEQSKKLLGKTEDRDYGLPDGMYNDDSDDDDDDIAADDDDDESDTIYCNHHHHHQ